MSKEITRYDPGQLGGMYARPDGDWVGYDEHQLALQAERRRGREDVLAVVREVLERRVWREAAKLIDARGAKSIEAICDEIEARAQEGG